MHGAVEDSELQLGTRRDNTLTSFFFPPSREDAFPPFRTALKINEDATFVHVSSNRPNLTYDAHMHGSLGEASGLQIYR
ncbi:hypothetical protein CSOJ01_00988 [Colletotrichum sojae]|uniref:Uncharacterized protein n=1 Tax=Colletotrichum sojae TaxID=2175907 RepID=A0A8H6N582_9PEZI|nr:hypothetical protein CSOJ01_00988 [Colletotrichum sojae]